MLRLAEAGVVLLAHAEQHWVLEGKTVLKVVAVEVGFLRLLLWRQGARALVAGEHQSDVDSLAEICNLP